MITVENFKKRHALSDSEYLRLETHIRSSYPDQQLTRTVGKDQKIIDSDLFEQYQASIRNATHNR